MYQLSSITYLQYIQIRDVEDKFTIASTKFGYESRFFLQKEFQFEEFVKIHTHVSHMVNKFSGMYDGVITDNFVH